MANGDARRCSSASPTADDSEPGIPALTRIRSGARSACGRSAAAAATQASTTAARRRESFGRACST